MPEAKTKSTSKSKAQRSELLTSFSVKRRLVKKEGKRNENAKKAKQSGGKGQPKKTRAEKLDGERDGYVCSLRCGRRGKNEVWLKCAVCGGW